MNELAVLILILCLPAILVYLSDYIVYFFASIIAFLKDAFT